VKHAEVLERLARESGRRLGELGVRPEDASWLRRHAATIASLTEDVAPSRRLTALLRRWARRAVRALR